jgi:hypothetical protein
MSGHFRALHCTMRGEQSREIAIDDGGAEVTDLNSFAHVSPDGLFGA